MCPLSIEAFILIGGVSNRLGRDKAFVEIAGRSLAERALDTVRHSKIAEKATFVAGSETQFAIQAITLDAPFIFDLVPHRGPLGGLHAALSYVETDWIFVLACDYPFVSPELLKFLDTKISSEFGVVVPQQPDRKLQSLCAFYKVVSARPMIEEIIQKQRVSPPLHEIIAGLNPRIVKFEEYSHLSHAEEFFVNVNTPQDLGLARRLSAAE